MPYTICQRLTQLTESREPSPTRPSSAKTAKSTPRRLSTLVVAAVAAMALIGLVPTSASADAKGFQPFGIGTGVLWHEVKGDGLTVNSDRAWFYTRRLCRWAIYFTYRDSDGRVYRNVRGRYHRGCSYLRGSDTAPRPGTLQAGKACARLKSGRQLIAEQCHNIKP